MYIYIEMNTLLYSFSRPPNLTSRRPHPVLPARGKPSEHHTLNKRLSFLAWPRLVHLNSPEPQTLDFQS